MSRALVCPGGGSWGEVQAASLVTLGQAGILKGVDHVFSNSAGTINACLLLAGMKQGVDLLTDAWKEITSDEQIYKPGFTKIAAHPWAHPIDEAGICHGALYGPSAFDTAPLQALAKRYLGDMTTKDIQEALGIIFMARAYSNSLGYGVKLQGLLRLMLRASSAIEVAFPWCKGFSDGGPVLNNPAADAIDAGVSEILVVYCGGESAVPPNDPIWIDDSTPEPTAKTGLQIGLGVLENLTQINEAATEARLAEFKRAGGKVIECYSRVPVPGSILDFSKQGRWQLGVAAAELAIADAQKVGW